MDKTGRRSKRISLRTCKLFHLLTWFPTMYKEDLLRYLSIGENAHFHAKLNSINSHIDIETTLLRVTLATVTLGTEMWRHSPAPRWAKSNLTSWHHVEVTTTTHRWIVSDVSSYDLLVAEVSPIRQVCIEAIYRKNLKI